MNRDEILAWLQQTNEARLADLWRMADATRRKHVGGEIHLRGLIEISNYCIRLCGYCGLRAPNQNIQRYRMTPDEIHQCVRRGVSLGYGTVVIQSGEDPGIKTDDVTQLVRFIKSETPLAVTLSLGERSEAELTEWRAAGADRYLLRFETSNPRLYERIHPPRKDGDPDRPAILGKLKILGYEVGSGVMIGIPGQTYDDLARDIALFADLDLDMIGCGPYLAHPATPLGATNVDLDLDMIGCGPYLAHPAIPLGATNQETFTPGEDQVPNTESMTYKVIALSRLVCPRANIPSTTALATINKATGREQGLVRGANVVMPNLTPPEYRELYEIYPDKACINETAEACFSCLADQIHSIGRQIGSGRGDSPNYQTREM